jgi:glyoxylase I family protein
LFKIKRLRHIAIVVNDLEKMIDYYTQFLDFKVKRRYLINNDEFQKGIGIPNASAKGAHLGSPNCEVELELLEFYGKTHKNTDFLLPDVNGFRHIAFAVNDLASCYNQLKSKGAEFISEPVAIKNPKELAGIQFVYLKDPEGNIIELSQLPADD